MSVDDYPDEQAEKELRQKIAAGSQDPEDYRNLSDLLFPGGRYDEIIALYRQALTIPLGGFKKARLSMELAWTYYEIGQRIPASFMAREAIVLLSTEPKDTETLYCLGSSQTVLSFSQSFNDPVAAMEGASLALESLEKAIAQDSEFEDKPYALIDTASLNCMLGNFDRAIANCEKCLGYKLTMMQRVSCLIAYVQALQGKERFMEAEHAIAEAFECGKNYNLGLCYRLHTERGQIFRSTNRLNEAKSSLEQAFAVLKSDPNFHNDMEVLGEVHFNLASVCYELGEFHAAISGYREVLRCQGDDLPVHWTALYWLGRSYEAIDEHAKAQDCCLEVLAAPRATEDARTLARKELAWVQAKLDYGSGKYAEAAAEFEEIVECSTKEEQDYWPAVFWLAWSYEGLGDYGKARTLYEDPLRSADASDTNSAIARNGLARSLANLAYESGDYNEAAAKFAEVLDQYPDTDPKHWNTFIWLASCYQGLNNYAKAQECYKKVLVSPHATDHDKVLARRRLTSSMGKAYYESGNYPEATAAFEEVLISCSENDPDRFHELVWLGYSCHAMGMLARARDCLERVLASPHALEADKTSARNGLVRLQSI